MNNLKISLPTVPVNESYPAGPFVATREQTYGRGFLFMNNPKWIRPDGIGHHSLFVENKPGVYLIIEYNIFTRKRMVVYVGSSMKLRSRSSKHPIYLKMWKNDRICSFAFKYCDDHIGLEKRLIRKFRPEFNIRHNG